jgi:hypothetical protein
LGMKIFLDTVNQQSAVSLGFVSFVWRVFLEYRRMA